MPTAALGSDSCPWRRAAGLVYPASWLLGRIGALPPNSLRLPCCVLRVGQGLACRVCAGACLRRRMHARSGRGSMCMWACLEFRGTGIVARAALWYAACYYEHYMQIRCGSTHSILTWRWCMPWWVFDVMFFGADVSRAASNKCHLVALLSCVVKRPVGHNPRLPSMYMRRHNTA